MVMLEESIVLAVIGLESFAYSVRNHESQLDCASKKQNSERNSFLPVLKLQQSRFCLDNPPPPKTAMHVTMFGGWGGSVVFF